MSTQFDPDSTSSSPQKKPWTTPALRIAEMRAAQGKSADTREKNKNFGAAS